MLPNTILLFFALIAGGVSLCAIIAFLFYTEEEPELYEQAERCNRKR